MKLDGKILVATAMMIGSMAAITGCNVPGADSSAVAPEETAATAPVEEEAKAGEQSFLRFSFNTGRRYYAPYGPPAARREYYGRAPSDRHFWAPGYYRWNGRQHVWVSGRWEARRAGYAYNAPRWERSSGRWVYVPGHWVRR
jgi:hypothetical protein